MPVHHSIILQLAVLSWLTSCTAPVLSDSSVHYNVINNGYLCINSNYTEIYPLISSENMCAYSCHLNQRCQAFSMADGPCQLFVFDKCSKSVRDCNCTRRGQVFVKQQPGLQPGALCPSGYVDDLCGVKYKMYSPIQSGSWSWSRQKCESESGLVIMSDVIDSTEMSHIDMLYGKYGIGSFWLGGFQAPGSSEPAGGWYWVGCNITLDSSLWGAGDPSNGFTNENATGRWFNHTMLNDFRDFSPTPLGVLCECQSPFE